MQDWQLSQDNFLNIANFSLFTVMFAYRPAMKFNAFLETFSGVKRLTTQDFP